MKVAIYCRVSTDDKGQDPQVQAGRCKEYCLNNGHEIIAIFIDEGISGDTFFYDRPQGKLLYDLINKNKVEGIVCFAIDRFSRQSPLKILPLLNNLQTRGVHFISVTESVFNMESEVAEPMRYMLSWFSNYFLKQHREKVNAGIQRAQKHGTKSGKSIGRQRKADYTEILKLSNDGLNLSQIAKQMNISKGSVSNCLNKSKRTSF